MKLKNKNVAFATLGCRTNRHDTAEMQTLLEQEGFSVVNSGESADVYVVNTCTVTQRSDYSSRLAVKKALSDLKHLPFKFENSGTRITYYD